MYRGTFIMGPFTSAISGIDQALWDIKGKYYNDRYMNLSVGRPGSSPGIRPLRRATAEEFIENAKAKIEEGFTALKPAFRVLWIPFRTISS